MKYFVISKCRLVDKNVYLMPDQIFSPDSPEYERTSRSLAAAIRSGWVRKATDEEIKKYESLTPPKVAPKIPVAQKPEKKDVALGAVEIKPEDIADEVISSEAILQARDKRRAESTASIPTPQVDVIPESNEQQQNEEELESTEAQEDTSASSDNEASSTEETETANDIKKEIEKKVKKKLPKRKKS